MTISIIRCQNCGHPADRHNGDHCAVRTCKGWSEQLRAFTETLVCTCDSYVGPPIPPAVLPGGCVHEVLLDSPNCVHCGTKTGAP